MIIIAIHTLLRNVQAFWEKNALSHKIKESRKKKLSLYSDLHQMLTGSILDQDLSASQVLWIYIQ